MKTLHNLILRNGLNSTVHSNGTDKFSAHKYIQDFYEWAFKPYQNRRVRILEIGTCTGASLFLWKNYFPNSDVYGIDVRDVVMPRFYRADIHYLKGDAYNPKNFQKIGKFDIIVDDGSHLVRDGLKFINIYFERLNKGGMMVLEDITSDAGLWLFKQAIKRKTHNEIKVLDNRYKACLNSRLLWVKK